MVVAVKEVTAAAIAVVAGVVMVTRDNNVRAILVFYFLGITIKEKRKETIGYAFFVFLIRSGQKRCARKKSKALIMAIATREREKDEISKVEVMKGSSDDPCRDLS